MKTASLKQEKINNKTRSKGHRSSTLVSYTRDLLVIQRHFHRFVSELRSYVKDQLPATSVERTVDFFFFEFIELLCVHRLNKARNRFFFQILS